MTKTLSSLALASSLLGTTALAQVETHPFTLTQDGAEIAGTLYLPAGHDGGALPTVVVTGAWTTVEEQMPRLYATEMVARGFAA
ncbi:MAG: alpha/beta hydrolase, partial [Pseudomonadota bacterium]